MNGMSHATGDSKCSNRFHMCVDGAKSEKARGSGERTTIEIQDGDDVFGEAAELGPAENEKELIVVADPSSAPATLSVADGAKDGQTTSWLVLIGGAGCLEPVGT